MCRAAGIGSQRSSLARSKTMRRAAASFKRERRCGQKRAPLLPRRKEGQGKGRGCPFSRAVSHYAEFGKTSARKEKERFHMAASGSRQGRVRVAPGPSQPASRRCRLLKRHCPEPNCRRTSARTTRTILGFAAESKTRQSSRQSQALLRFPLSRRFC